MSEKENPGAVARLFSTHPMTMDRIHRAQKEIDAEFAPREQYVVDTSEFQAIRARLNAAPKREVIAIVHLK